ncbi:DNA translocase FtsK [Bacteroidia bacterium]|nr:DNA translocase FtsK [Bacteroidia bacterium]
MAKKISDTTAKDDDEGIIPALQTFFKSSTTQYIAGLTIMVFVIYTGTAMVSYLFTGAADQSQVEGLSLFASGRFGGIDNWTGARGAILSHLLMNKWFGISNFFLLLFLIFLSLRLMKARYFHLFRDFVICSALTIWTSVALTFFFGRLFHDTVFPIGGAHGIVMKNWLEFNLGIPGTFLFLLLTLIIVLTLISSKTIPFLMRLTAKKEKSEEEDNDKNEDDLDRQSSEPKKKHWWQRTPKGDDDEDDEDAPEELLDHKPKVLTVPSIDTETTFVPKTNLDDFEVKIATGDEEETIVPTTIPITTTAKLPDSDKESEELLRELGPFDPTADLSHYQFPLLDFLKRYDSNDTVVNMEEQNENKNRIITTLGHYSIPIKSITATVGPTITLYEIVPEDGIKISKIKNLEDDIAMSLRATGIRIIAPMPGKGTIGIEVPNKDAKIVSMYSILASKKYQESHFELPIALGKTITNEVFMVDLAKMPHLLVAGATGQGKSVGLNAAITSLLYKKHPAELKFVLVDPKMVEFSIYSAIEKHFLATLPDAEKAIITDFTKVIATLNSLTTEMDDRYKLLEKAGSRNVKEYNEKFINRRLNPMKGHRFMPYIVVIIDEFGDLIMTAGKEIELPIARIAQKARAVGMHMIIATQRPTTNIITGTIKANFPARVAFRVTSAIDSRTILDSGGANQLIGRGDLLFSQGSDLTRVQCAFVDTPEVEKISQFIGSQQGYPTTYQLPEPVLESGSGGSGGIGSAESGAAGIDDLDPMFEESARLIVIHQQGSTSLIQRKFAIGYNRAGRIMDNLEKAGIVGPTQGSKPREVYIQDEAGLERILQSMK